MRALLSTPVPSSIRLSPASPSEAVSHPPQSPSALQPESRHAPAHASAHERCPATNARAALPSPQPSVSSAASPVPSVQENARPTDSNLPSDLATQAPPPEKQPAGDKDPGETFSLLPRSSPVSPTAGASRQSRAHPPAWSRCRPLVATLRTPETAASSPAAP